MAQRILAVLALILTTVSAGPRAFGEAGHRVVGLLAEMHLTDSEALAQVRRILRPGESLADASVWPDTIKNPLYEDEDTAIFRLDHPGHDTYHYANLPFQVERYDLSVPGARPTDMVQTMRESIRVLRGKSSFFRPREALRMLAHLVGDVHQPLHVGNTFVSAADPPRFVIPKGPAGWRSTLGGNMLLYGPEDRFNLHGYWDVHAVNISMRQEDPPGYAVRLSKTLPARSEWRGKGDVDSWPQQWATQALGHARAAHEGIAIVAYLGPDEARRNPHRWRIEQPGKYDDLARSLVPVQLAAAGYRLAETLRAIWPDRR
ncbi:MAG TPA: S1/P1 nuclease [Vicinamibacterales bacterium]|nr:S1/P1 nuclease [Vicinamibacterales bacterium]